MEEVAEGWRRLYNEQLHNLYASPSVIRAINSRRMGWAGQVARTEDIRKVYKVLVRKHEGKRPFGRSKCRWEAILEWILGKLAQIVDWMHLA
jgi:hypothetical protein